MGALVSLPGSGNGGRGSRRRPVIRHTPDWSCYLLCYNQLTSSRAHSALLLGVGEWLSLVEHLVRDQGVGGSNPLSPTISFQPLTNNHEIAGSEGIHKRVYIVRAGC